ncbi:hypothetical protein GGR56DRAFT_165997 [Xylariaceae sp. FL0804]|nr:hypothetical protein GGR56DRAFT_165997 [Xylariaceae sp. FL0804]
MTSPDRNLGPVGGTKRRHSGDESGPSASNKRHAAAGKYDIGESSTHTAAESLQPIGRPSHDGTFSSEQDPAGCGPAHAAKQERRGDDYYKSLYTVEPDFHRLGQQDHEFQDLLKHGSHLDFTDPRSVMQLSKTLLKLDFGLQLDLPTDRLCPPIPNRHNYILWLKGLLDSSYLPSDAPSPERRLTGLDIGTGASLIYPLLGCVQRPWSFVATDVDPKSLGYARKNAELNGYQSRIRIVQRTAPDKLIPLDELGLPTIDFTMTNPPFYTSEEELVDLARQKSRPPNAVCTGAPVEMVCEGGEIGFVQRIIDESLTLRERVQWYTSMLGKQSSLEVLVHRLRDSGITNYAITAFVQGNKTRRWALGWSFGGKRPAQCVSCGFEPSAGKKILPPPTEARITTRGLQNKDTLDQLRVTVCSSMSALDLLSWSWDEQRLRGVGFSDGNVWSRAYRRMKARESQYVHAQPTPRAESATGKHMPDAIAHAFGFAIQLREEGNTNNVSDQGSGDGHGNTIIVLRWLQGGDYTLLESLAGVLRKSIAEIRVVEQAAGHFG